LNNNQSDSYYPYYLKEKGITWFNPCYGLNGFWPEFRRIRKELDKSFDFVWNHRSLKRAKEIYTTSIIAKAIEKKENTGPWWVLKPKIDPPDGVIGTIIQEGELPRLHFREIEVVEHIEGDIVDTIRKKLTGKAYEPSTILACYLSKGSILNLERESEIISKEITSLNHIFLFFPGLNFSEIAFNEDKDTFIKSMLKVSAVEIKPIFSTSTIDLIEDCKNWRDGKEKNFYIFNGLGKVEPHPITLNNPPKLF
jgi:hypothetical protein